MSDKLKPSDYKPAPKAIADDFGAFSELPRNQKEYDELSDDETSDDSDEA